MYQYYLFFEGGRWVLGNQGDSCDETCSRNESICNTNAQSKLTTEKLVYETMIEAGYECTTFQSSDYIGAPMASGNNDALECFVIAVGAESVCDVSPCGGPKCDIRRLCYCQKGKQILP